MKPTDRARLTTQLRDHVAKIAADLRMKMRGQAPGSNDVRERAKQLHADERVAEDFDVWTDLLSRRASVLWVLKSVYVRVLEDRGLLIPGRLLDLEAQQLFERLAPHLGETAFLKWIYRDLASKNGGLPELFSPQPAEVALPSDELSRALIAFWRHRDADTGTHWSFAEEHFEGELMGDLYQDLDPVVKDRFALCQTPDFVRAFILDRTLTSAIQTFGADKVRLLDPACGSGHFLIDGLKRIVAVTTAQHSDWSRPKIVLHVLNRVVGIDLNDYACALARTRLVMTAAELAGVSTLADAAQFHPHVYWADGLEQVECEEAKPTLQFSLFEKAEDKPRATLTRSDVRVSLRKVIANKFHAVVANPPYITEKDAARKEYHREKIGRTQRYVSAYREYSLGSPFTERCFQLAVPDGFIGIITSNNFMKREFGKPLIEKVLANVDVFLVVDTSKAYIPHHGTPTALLFGRNRRSSSEHICAVMGKGREPGTPTNPALGKVWSSIAEGWSTIGFQNEFISVSNLPRAILSKYPWSLGGGGAAELKTLIEEKSANKLGSIAHEIGVACVLREDDLFIQDDAARRRGVLSESIQVCIEGFNVRDWGISGCSDVIWPYDAESLQLSNGDRCEAIQRCLWPWRTILAKRSAFGKMQAERGLAWWEYSMLFQGRYGAPLLLSFPKVATHNHFALHRRGPVPIASTHIIQLSAGSSEEEHLALLGILNSSTACFWMKQVFHPKTHASQRHHPDPARGVYEFAATGLQAFPVPELGELRSAVVQLAKLLDEFAQQRSRLLDKAFLVNEINSGATAKQLSACLIQRWHDSDTLREHMVALQEELDWCVYVAFGLASDVCLVAPERRRELTCPRGARPFERLHGRSSTVRSGGRGLTLEEGEIAPVGTLSAWMEKTWKCREQVINSSEVIQLIETPVFKRAWRDTDQNIPEAEYRRRKDDGDLRLWFASELERWASKRESPFTIGQAFAGLQDDSFILSVAEAVSKRPDFSVESLLVAAINDDAVPQHRFHLYTDSGRAKYSAWEDVWAMQRREDSGEIIGDIASPPEYSQGSRGKATDFIRNEYWQLRGKLDVPKERFIAFTEVPGRSGAETLYGWAGWTSLQRLKAILAVDEELEDGGAPLADRIGLLDSAWRLLPDVAREDAAAATRLKAELQALVGPEGPSRELLEDWKKRFPPPTAHKAKKAKGAAAKQDDKGEDEESEVT